MRAVTRHLLTGALLATAAVGVAIAADHPWAVGNAVPVSDTAAAPASDGHTAGEGREAANSRSEERQPVASKPTVASSEAVTSRQEQLKAQKSKMSAAAEDLLEQKIKREGYDPRTAKTPREIGRQIAANLYGWSGAQWTCYDKLIVSESNWNTFATNPSSGAYGIPQSLPANKMATAGPDWRTNPATQIRWGLKYVQQVYGTPCSAWSFKQGHNWY